MADIKKVFIATSSFGKCSPKPLAILRDHKFKVISNPYGRKLTREEVIKLAQGCQGIISGLEPLDKDVLDNLKYLRCISRCGVGMDNIDLERAKELNIKVKNTPDGPTQAVSELTIGLIFSLLRMISLRDRLIRQGKWPKEMGFLLDGKVAGILGLGRIGRRVSELLLGLGAKVIGTDLNPDRKWAKKFGVKIVTLPNLLKNVDILSIHISLSDSSKYVIGKNEIKNIKKGAYLINVSRGGVVDEAAVYQALKSGKLAGAAFDVFKKEPYQGKLKSLDNVILSPHVGSYAKEARIKMEIETVKNLLEGLKNSQH